jgi:DHA1 family tetracycline resistance protein-like MFS transporter
MGTGLAPRGELRLSSIAPASTGKSTGNAAFIFIFVTVLLDFLAFGIVAPVLPNLIIQFSGGNIAHAATITGYFAFAWATMQFIFSPILGAWSDRFGRRPIILLSCAGLGFDYILMALAPSVSWLFLGRILSGITTSNVSTAFAYTTDVTAPENRAKRFGMLSAAFGLGFIIGPAVGGLLGNFSLRMPFWVAAGLSLANAIYGYFILPESLPLDRRAKSAWHMANPLGSFTLLRSQPGLGGLAVVLALYYFAQQSLQSTFVLHADYRYHWSSRTVGLSLAAVGLGIVIVAGVLVGPIVKKIGERRSILWGLAIGMFAFIGFGASYKGWMVFAVIPLIALWGIAAPALQTLMTQKVDATSQGKLQGAINGLRAITGMFGPLIFTQVLAFAISPSHRVHVPGSPFFLAAILMLASLLVAYAVARPGNSKSSSTPLEIDVPVPSPNIEL